MAKDIKTLLSEMESKEAETLKIAADIAKSAKVELKTKLADAASLFRYVPAKGLGKLLERFGLRLQGVASGKVRKRRPMSAEAKAKIAAAQKKRWAKRKAS